MPTLTTERLVIRPFVQEDLAAIYQLLDVDLRDVDMGNEKPVSPAEREEWLRWSILNTEQLANLFQPPYGDRAVVLQATNELIGAIGYVQCLFPAEQLPHEPGGPVHPSHALYTTDFGLFYAFAPGHRRQGYATEATRAMIEYAFTTLRLKRIVATTQYTNAASMGVMRKAGMRIERNPFPEPPWLQVVGILENQRRDADEKPNMRSPG